LTIRQTLAAGRFVTFLARKVGQGEKKEMDKDGNMIVVGLSKYISEQKDNDGWNGVDVNKQHDQRFALKNT